MTRGLLSNLHLFNLSNRTEGALAESPRPLKAPREHACPRVGRGVTIGYDGLRGSQGVTRLKKGLQESQGVTMYEKGTMD